jgi:hypothetical protein
MEMFCSASENSNQVFFPAKVEYSENYAKNTKHQVYCKGNFVEQQSESEYDKLNISY